TLVPLIEWQALPETLKNKNGLMEYQSLINEQIHFVNTYPSLNSIKEKSISLRLLSLMRKCRDLSNSDLGRIQT
ncbi:hypothetical protein, partial [Acinetobacter baumannii]